MRFPIALLAFSVVAAFSLTACAADEQAAYRKSFSPLSNDIVTTGRGVDEAIRTAGSMKNDAAVAVAFARLSSDASHVAGSLASVTPPESFSKDHRLLIRGLRQAASKLSRVSQAAVDGDVAAAKAATAEAASVSSKVREPRRRIVGKLGLE